MVLDVWRDRHAEVERQNRLLQKRVQELREQKKKLTEAYIYSQTVDCETYEEMLRDLNRGLANAELEQQDGRIEEIDIDGAPDFAKIILSRADRLWLEADLQRFQSVLFPRGLEYRKNEGVRTALTVSLFRSLQGSEEAKYGMVPRRGFEPRTP